MLFSYFDIKGSGSIDCDEFTKYYANVLYDPHRDQVYIQYLAISAFSVLRYGGISTLKVGFVIT
jgi:hypothetical protein